MSSKTNTEEDEDCLFLERVLDTLYDFGQKPASKKKQKSQKKKKRKRYEEEEEEEGCSAVNDFFGDTEDNRRSLGEDEDLQEPRTAQTGAIVPQVEVVTFQDPRKKQKTKDTHVPEKKLTTRITVTEEEDESCQPQELNLEKARLEVHRFGITGYKKEQQRVFERDRAVMLGARPPKKDYVNYKQLQLQIKEKKEKPKEDIQPELKKKKNKKQGSQREKSKKASSGSGTAPSGQVGRFKNGMLILSSKEIQKIKGNKRGK